MGHLHDPEVRRYEYLLRRMPGSRVHHYAGGTTEDLSAQLAQRCPAYFKEDDKLFYEASGLLQRAEAATAAAEKDHLTHSALKLMMKVGTSSLDLSLVC